MKKTKSMASVERALGIPQKTLSKDKTAAGKALKKILKAFPWIVDVAEKKYEEKEAKKIMIKNGVEEALKHL